MDSYFQNIILLTKRLIVALLFFSISQILFFVYNQELFEHVNISLYTKYWIDGIRFDLISLFIFNTPFIILSLAPVFFYRFEGFKKGLKVLFGISNGLLIALNFIDIPFYEFEGKRLTSDFFSSEWLGNDFINALPNLISDYWYLFLIYIFILYLLLRYYPKDKRNYFPQRLQIKWPTSVLNFIIVVFTVVVSLLIIRGGFQLRPLGIISATDYAPPEHIALIINSPFSIIKTLGKKPLTVPTYFNNKELSNIYSPEHQYQNHPLRKKNVVIIILESFGKEYSGFLNNRKGFTPKLDSIMKQGLLFRRAFANGRRSIEALPSIFSSIPSLTDNAFVKTAYSTNKIEGIGTILSNIGYHTAFYHGGANGTMDFNHYVIIAGIKHYFGKSEYPKNNYDGTWGIYDEPYLQYFISQLNKMPQPFFSTVFTLSSHHPYKIPEKYKNKFPEGDLPILESIGYADYALGKFFESAAKQPWFQNTIFVLTADHTSLTNHPFYKTNVGRYAIPIIYYAPGDTTVRGISDRITQQADIAPSLLDYLGYPNKFIAFGNSVFSDSLQFAINHINGVYQFIRPNEAIRFDGKKVLKITTALMPEDSLKKHQINESEYSNDIKLMKAVIQQFNYRMVNNKLIPNP